MFVIEVYTPTFWFSVVKVRIVALALGDKADNVANLMTLSNGGLVAWLSWVLFVV